MINSTRLDGVALVVGSARGIGKEAAFSLAEAGAKVVVFADKDEEAAESTAQESHQYASNKEYSTAIFKMNIGDDASVQAMVDFVVQKFGRLDYAVNAAGIDNGIPAPIAETDMDRFDEVMRINTRGNMLCVRAQVAAMRKQEPKTWSSRSGNSTRDIGRGAIVNIGSANSFAGLPSKGSYTISKHAFNGITKMAALDHSAEGIRVNAVCPTWVRTPLLDIEFERNPEVQGMISAVVPIKRAAECEEVSDAIAFLCSPAASYINGAGLLIDAAVTTTCRIY
ncbi:oxidoreductase [Xylariaceae sp. FL1272]|nr:oxidoreductase [Xylariaceae sp. FL1272]